MFKFRALFGLAALLTGPCATVVKAVPAFPSAEGFGANAVGGRGGRVIEVTNRRDSGPGSLRACVEATGPRTCVFRTGGTIALRSRLSVREENSYLTIAGQTAPGGGIQLKDWFLEVSYGGHDVIVRNLRIRQGTGHGSSDEEINNNCGGVLLYGGENPDLHVYNVIVDHSSIEWACDDSLQAWANVTDATVQWSLIGEGLTNDDYPNANSKGYIMGGTLGSGNTVSLHHNLIVHSSDRNPLVDGANPLDFRNNVVYNWLGCQGNVELKTISGATSNVNLVGSVYVPGPDSNTTTCFLGTAAGAARVYVEDNSTPFCTQGCSTLADVGLVDSVAYEPLPDVPFRALTAFPAPAITATPIDDLESVLATTVGAVVPRRDALDSRLVDELRTRTGDVGRNGAAYPKLAKGQAPADGDHDGMPDAWEVAHALDPADPNDGSATSANGYTNLENYLNELAGDVIP